MRNTLRWLVILIGGFLCAAPAESQTPSVVPHYYGVEHGIVEYQISGADQGKQTLYFDQWGLRQARYKVVETQRWGTTSTVTLNLGSDILTYNPNKNLGQKKEDLNLKQLLANFKPQETQILSLQVLGLLGGKKIKEDTVLDRVCEVWETPTPKMKVWLYNGVVLKLEEDTPEGMVIYTAVSIDGASVVDEKYFLVPPEVHFINRDINQILISKRM